MSSILRQFVFGFLLVVSLSACSFIEKFDSPPEMTSPCVGDDGSPCGPKRPVNEFLLRQHNVTLLI